VIVVSDTSPILNLAAVGHLDLLPKLYGSVVMPPSVERELRRNGFTGSPNWLTVIQPVGRAEIVGLLEDLHPGEAEAIVLAREMNADKLLIDERRGRAIAIERGLPVTGVLGILADAKRFGFIEECAPILRSMVDTVDFWVSENLRTRFLRSVGEE
jgi:hypothetical protein